MKAQYVKFTATPYLWSPVTRVPIKAKEVEMVFISICRSDLVFSSTI